MFDTGVDSPLGELVPLVRSLVAGVDVDGLDALAAARVVEECAEAERLLAALRVVSAATLTDKALWRREGFRSVATWMASKTGTAVGTAIATMEMVEQLDHLPATEAAFRAGFLSEVQARQIADAASVAPEAEQELLTAAGKLSLRGLQDECRRVEAAAIDDDERYRRVHRTRRYRSWVDRDGYGRVSAWVTPDDLARIDGEVDRRYVDIVEDAVRGGWFESVEAHRLDAFLDLVRPENPAPTGPPHMVHVVVDYDALMRGHAVAGEQCEIPGIGPIPVSLARQMSDDAFLKILLTRGVDIVAVAHGGQTIPAHLRTALEIRDPKCIVPRCGVRKGLEIDHRGTYARTRLTSLENNGRLCRWHHHLKTFCGYTYRRLPDGSWQWIPPPDRDVDLSPLRRAITSARRC